MKDEATITISHIEMLALKKLVLINSALASLPVSARVAGEQLALTRVLIDIANRADLALNTPDAA